MHSYWFNGVIRLPAHGKCAAGGRSTVNGDVSFPQPVTEEQLKTVIAKEKAERIGCDPAGITFVDFTYTEVGA